VLAGKKTVPERIVQARSVALGYDLGDRFVSEGASAAEPGVGPEGRRALQAVSQEFRRWGRYAVVNRPEEADLLVGIRLRRSASASGGIGGGVSNGAGGLGGTFDGSVRRGSSYNIDYSANDDVLSVYDGADGKVGKLLWHKSKAYGLTGDNSALVAQFRTDVERTPATPGQAATKPPQ
jgi:hypothetical protein